MPWAIKFDNGAYHAAFGTGHEAVLDEAARYETFERAMDVSAELVGVAEIVEVLACPTAPSKYPANYAQSLRVSDNPTHVAVLQIMDDNPFLGANALSQEQRDQVAVMLEQAWIKGWSFD